MDFYRHGIHRPGKSRGMNKGFNKPGEYAAVLERLAERNVYAITSFIFGMDNDTPGVADRTLAAGTVGGRRGCRFLACRFPSLPPPLYTRLE